DEQQPERHHPELIGLGGREGPGGADGPQDDPQGHAAADQGDAERGSPGPSRNDVGSPVRGDRHRQACYHPLHSRWMNEGYDYRERVQPQAGETVLAYLARRYPHSTAETWAERIAAGEVTVDGSVANAAAGVSPGQT